MQKYSVFLPFSLILSVSPFLFLSCLIPLHVPQQSLKNTQTHSLSKTIFDWAVRSHQRHDRIFYHSHINANYKQRQPRKKRKKQTNVKREQNGSTTRKRVCSKMDEKMDRRINSNICDIIICGLYLWPYLIRVHLDIMQVKREWFSYHINFVSTSSQPGRQYSLYCKSNMIRTRVLVVLLRIY